MLRSASLRLLAWPGLLLVSLTQPAAAGPLRLMDVFELEHASDPQVSPDGKHVAYVRHRMDIMKDRKRSSIWIVGVDGTGHQPLTPGEHDAQSPRWSPDGSRLLTIDRSSGSAQLYCLWLESGRSARLTSLPSPPVGPVWSPDGKQIAFASLVEEKPRPLVELPKKPEGAEWAPAPRVIQEVTYRHDGQGYLKAGHYQLFVVSAEGGTARQVTSGRFHHATSGVSPRGPVWSPDGKHLIFAANRREDADHFPLDTELYQVSLATGKIEQLTDRRGPDHSPAISPDGRRIAYLGFDDRKQGYQLTTLHLLEGQGGKSRVLTGKLDRSVRSPVWSADGKGVYFLYDDQGVTHAGFVTLDGELETLVGDVGGESLGRPYAAGAFSVAPSGLLAFTRASPTRPADVAILAPGASPRLITQLNEDLLQDRDLGQLEEIWLKSEHDGTRIQAWLLRPPGFTPERKYPLILEIHGGPFANYGPRFSMEMQLYAAAGYLVLYVNPRGSTSYGEKFGNLIHHAYPGHDYDDLMSAVNVVLKRGHADPERLFVTGGSGGGVLSAWIIGKTDRFRAAVVAKPVISWHSFVLTADSYPFFTQYWFPAPPWEDPEHYRRRSPLSLVGNVKTPTMLITGEEDHRTPMSQSEELYQALKLRRIPAALVRVPGAAHNIAARPSHLMAKVAHVLKWFEIYDPAR